MHPTDAMLWVARTPGVWPQPLPEDQARALLDGLYDLGSRPRRGWSTSSPTSAPPRTIHDAACLPEGFRVKGLRGEPTHWVPWDKVELICAGRIEAEDEFRGVRPADAGPRPWRPGLRALTLRKPRARPPPRPRASASRATRSAR